MEIRLRNLSCVHLKGKRFCSSVPWVPFERAIPLKRRYMIRVPCVNGQHQMPLKSKNMKKWRNPHCRLFSILSLRTFILN